MTNAEAVKQITALLSNARINRLNSDDIAALDHARLVLAAQDDERERLHGLLRATVTSHRDAAAGDEADMYTERNHE